MKPPYLGPESIMPIASILAAVAGILLIFGRFILSSIKRLFRLNKDQGDPEDLEESSPPNPIEDA